VEPIELPLGNDLTVAEAAETMTSGLSRLIVVAGAPFCGKTTLLDGFYELFQEGKVDRLIFGGSETLVGFEKRCHLAREVSGQKTAITERSLFSAKGNFLHLKLCDTEAALAPTHLLLADIIGEFYDSLRDSTTECQQHEFLRRADHLLVLVDGARLATIETRHQVVDEAKMLLRSLSDSGMLSGQTEVAVIITKWDKIQKAKANHVGQELDEYLNGCIRQAFPTSAWKWRVGKVAARPDSGSPLEFGFGLKDLLLRITLTSSRDSTAMVVFAGRGQRHIERFNNPPIVAPHEG
jgi:Double-GTPase 2